MLKVTLVLKLRVEETNAQNNPIFMQIRTFCVNRLKDKTFIKTTLKFLDIL